MLKFVPVLTKQKARKQKPLASHPRANNAARVAPKNIFWPIAGACPLLLFLPDTVHIEYARRWQIITKDLRINEEIRVREIRLVGSDSQQLGVVPIKEGLRIAVEQGLDLVEVAPQAKPPVCRIMDYGKYKYEQSKRDREARKKQKVIEIKELKLRPKIEEHDFQVKVKNAQRFLLDGDKVKVTLMFRGREISHSELGRSLSLKLFKTLEDQAIMEKEPRIEGRNMIMILAPKNQEQPKGE
jgi:translation initiation factor IF-3